MWSLLSVFGLNLLTGVTKKWVKPKWGDTGIHVLVFIIALIGVGLKMLYEHNLAWKMLLEQSVVYMGAAITFYEILWKQVMPTKKKK